MTERLLIRGGLVIDPAQDLGRQEEFERTAHEEALMGAVGEGPARGGVQDHHAQAAAGALEDITGGATSYYALSMTTPPYWAASMTPTVVIAGQKFFR